MAFVLSCFIALSGLSSAALDQTTLTSLSQGISFDLVDFGSRILGTTAMEAHLATLAAPAIGPQGIVTLNTIDFTVSNFLSERAQVAFEVQNLVLNSYARTTTSNPSQVIECCMANASTFSELFGRLVDLDKTCNRYPAGFVASQNLEDLRVANEIQAGMAGIRNRHETVLSFYYASANSGLHTRNPSEKTGGVNCNNYDPRFRPWYVESTTIPKMVILVIDCSGSMTNQNRMATAKTAAKTVLETLNPLDYVQVVKFESSATTFQPLETSCEDIAIPATARNVDLLLAFVDSFTANGGTNFAAALTAAYHIVSTTRAANVSETLPTAIIFMTDGESTPFSPTEPLVNRPIIFSFAFGSGVGQTYLTYLESLATNTNGRYAQIPDGNANQLRTTMGSYYLHPRFSNENRNVTMSLPYVTTSFGMALTLGLPVYSNEVFRGVVGIDMSLHELREAVRSSFDTELFSHAFVCNSRGKALIHPNLPSPQTVFADAVSIGIDMLEGGDGNPTFRAAFAQSLISGEPGSLYVTNITKSLSRGQGNEGTAVTVVNGTYYWKMVQVTNTALTLIVGVFLVDPEFRLSKRINPNLPVPSSANLFHRFDLLPNRTVATQIEFGSGVLLATEASAVSFASTLYLNANRYLFGPQLTKTEVEQISHYMNVAPAGPDPNYLLKPQAQADTRATQYAEEIWKSPLLYGDTSPDQILSRYIGTIDGTFRKFPGTRMNRNFNPVARPWFQRALRNPHKFALSQPYDAASGSGTVLTLSKVVSMSNSSKEGANTVMGMNFLVPKFDSLIRNRISSISTGSTTILIVDSSGYILFSSAVRNAKTSPFLGVSYPSVASSLYSQGLLVPSLCNNLNASSVDTSFELTGGTLPQVLYFSCGSIGHALIAQTNTFLLTFESSFNCNSSPCSSSASSCYSAYCPCSQVMPYYNCKGEFGMAANPTCVLPVAEAIELTPTLTPTFTTTPSNSDAGVIAGAVMGSLALVAVLCGLVYYNRNQDQVRAPTDEGKSIPMADIVRDASLL